MNVSYPLPLIIVGHTHVWHLPLTSAPQQAQLLKGQTFQLMSIILTLSSLSVLIYIYIHFLLVRLGSVANLKLKEEEKSGVNLTCS